MRASAAVNCQSTVTCAALRRASQAATSLHQGGLVWDAPVETLAGQHGQFALGDVEPTAVLGRVVPLDLGGDAPGFGRLETLVQAGWAMRVQVVGDQDDHVGVRIVFVDQDAQLFGKVLRGAAIRHPHLAPTGQRLNRQEQIADAVAFVLVVLALRLAWVDRQAAARRAVQFLAGFVQADHGPLGVVGPGIDLQHVFHLGDVLGGRLADAPGLYPPRLEFVFLSSSRTVTWLMYVHVTEFDHLVGQQAQRPAGEALRRVTAGQHGQLGFDLAGELGRRARPALVVQGDRYATGEKATANVAHRA